MRLKSKILVGLMGTLCSTLMYLQLETLELRVTDTTQGLPLRGRAGEIIEFSRHVYLERPVDVTVDWAVYQDGQPVVLLGTEGVAVTKHYEPYNPVNTDIILQFKIPDELPVGVYEFTPIARYKINKLKSVVQNLPTAPFIVEE